jgi:nucleoside-diphosphate-sugar epimerase
MYGWAKLIAELTLKAYYREYGMKAGPCRYFTLYGPREVENDAVIAIIAKAFFAQNPFVVWRGWHPGGQLDVYRAYCPGHYPGRRKDR